MSKLKPYDDGHKHAFTYFGGMASCVHCAARLEPGGKVLAPNASSKRHRDKALAARKK